MVKLFKRFDIKFRRKDIMTVSQLDKQLKLVMPESYSEKQIKIKDLSQWPKGIEAKSVIVQLFQNFHKRLHLKMAKRFI